MQKAHLIKDCYSKYSKNSYNSARKKSYFKKGPKTLTNTSQNKTHRWQISCEKKLYTLSSGKHRLKQQVTTTHLSEYPKSGTLAILTAGGDVDQHELSDITDQNAK